MVEEVFSYADNLQILPLDTSLPGNPKLVCVNGKNYQLSGVALNVLECIDLQARSTSDIGRRFKNRYGYDCPNETLEQVLSKLASLSILLVAAESKLRPPVKKTAWWSKFFLSYFAVRVDIFPAALLRPVTSRISWLFRPSWMAAGIPLMLILQILFSRSHFHDMVHQLPTLAPTAFLWVLVFNYLGLFLHELGHASACISRGIEHGNVGAGLYLIFPAFYTDVSRAWALSRKDRMVVDGGGIYLSLILASIASAGYKFTGNPVFGILAILYDVTVFMNFNPFVRMDGYWLLSDALGIQNMMQANQELSKWLMTFWKGKTRKRPGILGLPPMHRNIYLVYYLFFTTFVVYFGIAFYGWYLPRFLAGYPEMIRQAALVVRAHLVSWTSVRTLVRLLFNSLPILGPAIYGGRLVVKMLRRFTKPEDTEAARARLGLKERALS